MLSEHRLSLKPGHTWLSVLLLVIVISSFIPFVRGDFSIGISQDKVAVRISGDLTQGVPSQLPNTTAYEVGTIPNFDGHLSAENSSYLAGLLSKAISQKTSGAIISDPYLVASSRAGAVHYDLDFNISGITYTNQVVERVNLAWRSFAIADDFSVSNASLNHLFLNYLRSGLLFFIETAGPVAGGLVPTTNILYLNDRIVQKGSASIVTQNLLLFNFSSLSLPLQFWTATNPDSSTTLLRSSTGFNLTFMRTYNEAGEIARADWNIFYKLTATIRAPYPSTVSNDQIEFETAKTGGTYQVMLGVASLSAVVLGSTLLLESRLQARAFQRKGKRKG